MNFKTITGGIMIFFSLILTIFTYSHRPVEGFMDALQRGDSRVLNSGPYAFFILFSLGLFLGGVILIYKGIKARK